LRVFEIENPRDVIWDNDDEKSVFITLKDWFINFFNFEFCNFLKFEIFSNQLPNLYRDPVFVIGYFSFHEKHPVWEADGLDRSFNLFF
jgi:hypothetical protein